MVDYKNIENRMDKVIEHLSDGFANIRAGRANPAILNRVTVDYYGSETPLNQVASVSVPEARQILIAPWDKSMIPLIEKAIQKSDIGINPMSDGNGVRLIFPDLNEQRRKEIVKDIKKMGEEGKVAVRNIRRDAMDEVKASQKASEISEDEQESSEEQIQKITDKYIASIDKIMEIKEKEIMEI